MNPLRLFGFRIVSLVHSIEVDIVCLLRKFGLAASVLWPGTLIGNYISISGELRAALLLFRFGISLFSILYSERKISHEKSN